MRKWICAACIVSSSFLSANDQGWQNFKSDVLRSQDQIMGWCTEEKAEKLMDLIHKVKPELCVEIGVFGGSSVYPTASALKYESKGVVYAIDPWQAAPALEGYASDDANYGWWSMLNYEDVYHHFLEMLGKFGLNNHCHVLRCTSEQALENFADESIDILHLDGNHTEDSAYRDIVNYLPKVKPGGYIWFDDANWISTRKAISYAYKHAELLYNDSVNEACLLFRKPLN